MRSTAAVLILMAACGGSAPAPGAPGSSSTPATAPASQGGDPASGPPIAAGDKPLEDDLPTLVVRAVEMFEGVATVVAAGGTDCAASAAKLRGMRGRYDVVITAARKVESSGRGDEMESLLQPYEGRLKAAIEKMRPGIEACMGNPDFQHAFDDITGPGAGAP